MKRLLSLFLCLICCSVAGAQSSQDGGQDRMFFPHDTFWGYGQFDLAGPHNEIDPNLCASNAKDFGGKNAPCSEFARYMLSGYVEMRPFGRGIFRRAMFFGEPRMLFGRTVPQALYTWSFDAIGLENSWGSGFISERVSNFAPPSTFFLIGGAVVTAIWVLPISGQTVRGDATTR